MVNARRGCRGQGQVEEDDLLWRFMTRGDPKKVQVVARSLGCRLESVFSSRDLLSWSRISCFLEL